MIDLERAADYASQCDEIMALYLIGSHGTQHQTPLSDVDFAFLTRHALDIKRQTEIEAELSDIVNLDNIDVVFLDRASLQFRYKVLAEGRLLYQRDAVFLSDFQERTVKLYLDFAIDLDQFNRDYDHALRKEFLNG